jgi:hypothetical protein
MNEDIDISNTKFRDQIDNTQYHVIQPLENQLYVEWPGP